MSKTRIVIVEDEPDILRFMSYNLKREGFRVFTASSGDEALELVKSKSPALVLLDLMLPGLPGEEVCRKLKSDPLTSHIPIIMVSAKGEESDIVIGLGIGADDYLHKPLRSRELTARVKAVLRRVSKERQDREEISLHGLTINSGRHEVRMNGELIDLTATEFRLLHQLALKPGHAFTREQLQNRVARGGAVMQSRSIDVHIRSVRRKLGEASDIIQTIRSVGYRLKTPD